MKPKIIHQIWIGNDPSEEIVSYMDSVKNMNPDFEYKLYGNDCLKKYDLDHLLGKTKESFISNILRVKLLEEYGGWYIDADTIAYDNLSKLTNYDSNRLIVSELDGSYKLNNSIIGADKGFDFSKFLDIYVPNNICIPIWNILYNENNTTSIPINEFGMEGTIYKDIRLNSWGD